MQMIEALRSGNSRPLDRPATTRTDELHRSQVRVIQVLSRAAGYKDDCTGKHLERMSRYARVLGCAVGMTDARADMLMHAAPMHDIGKIGIPDSILRKTGCLDEHEWAVMRTHCEIGARILGEYADRMPLLEMARDIALCHHESWDGSGYPRGLSGTAIPLEARIVTVADVFDALTSHRPYKPAWPVERAVAWLQDQAGSHLDPRLVGCFVSSIAEVLRERDKVGAE